MNQRSGHLWSLLDWERGRSHLFVPVQGCKVSGRVSVGDGAPRPGEHHPCPPSSRAKAAGAGRASRERGADCCRLEAPSPDNFTFAEVLDIRCESMPGSSFGRYLRGYIKSNCAATPQSCDLRIYLAAIVSDD